MNNEELKDAIFKIMSGRAFKKQRKSAVKRSHEFLAGIGDITPLELTLFLSHCMSHILMAAPEKHNIPEMLGVFMTDLDYTGIMEEWQKERDNPSDEAEAEVEGRVTLH